MAHNNTLASSAYVGTTGTSTSSTYVGTLGTSNTFLGSCVSIGSGSLTTGSSNYATITGNQMSVKYHILGEDVEIKGSYQDTNITIIISTLNVLGVKFYDELLKNNVTFHGDLKTHIERIVNQRRRDDNIDILISK